MRRKQNSVLLFAAIATIMAASVVCGGCGNPAPTDPSADSKAPIKPAAITKDSLANPLCTGKGICIISAAVAEKSIPVSFKLVGSTAPAIVRNVVFGKSSENISQIPGTTAMQFIMSFSLKALKDSQPDEVALFESATKIYTFDAPFDVTHIFPAGILAAPAVVTIPNQTSVKITGDVVATTVTFFH